MLKVIYDSVFCAFILLIQYSPLCVVYGGVDSHMQGARFCLFSVTCLFSVLQIISPSKIMHTTLLSLR
jgi:hypothetical protein